MKKEFTRRDASFPVGKWRLTVLFRKQLYLLCAITLLTSFTATSQGLTVTGKVVDETGESLPGVNVILKGTVTGQTTDADGTYSIDLPDNNSILVFSYVGFQSQEISVANRTRLDVTMVRDASQLDEVVVVGYGTMEKSDLTGAIAKVNIEQQRELSNVNVLQSLQGAVPGLNIGQVTTSGSTPSMTIRGQNTLSSSSSDNAPLLVVDGIIYRGSIMDINPSDIESIEVLKDASSASIYGSQAANGVVLITSKKGEKFGKPVISYAGQYSIQSPSNTLQPYNGGDEYENFLLDVFWDQSRTPPNYSEPDPDFLLDPVLKTLEISEGYKIGRNTDWWGMLTGNGHISSHNVSIRGSNEKASYFVSGGFTDQTGFIVNDDYSRVSLRANLDLGITDWLDFGFESFLANSDYSGVSPSITSAFHLQPYAPLYDENGEYFVQPDGALLNPFLQYQVDDSDKRLNLFGNFHVDVKLPFLEGFNYRVNYSHNYRSSNHYQFNRWGANFTGAGFKDSDIGYDWILDNILSYQRSLGQDHRINVTLLYGLEERQNEYTNASAQGFSNPLLGYNRLQAGDASLNEVETGAWAETSLYMMSRVFYSYKNKYMLTGTVRRDGFSGFGTENKTGIFPSLAAGWVVSEESFLDSQLLDYLKLRVSYGTTARRAVSRYQTLARMSSAPTRVFGDGGSTTIGQWVSSMGNDKLGWETTTGLNAGVDFELFHSRIIGNIEYYRNRTNDILYNIELPYMAGFATVAANIGEVKNHGFEFAISAYPLVNRKVEWNVNLNFSSYRNEIVSILGMDNDNDGKEDDLVTNRLFIGEPQGVIYDYEIAGMWQLSDGEAGNIPAGFFPGTYKITDLNEDGSISADDRRILGYRDPAYRFGIGNTIKYNRFSLYVFINSIQGGRDYYYGDGSPYASSNFIRRDQLTYSNALKWDYWTPQNPDAKYRRLDTHSSFAPRPYDQRNFVRLQDVSLSYNFGPDILEKIRLRNLKVNLSAKNLVTITKWEGIDPETGVGLVPGLPVMRSYTVGLNLEF